jgi:transcriptional regulator with XRE-family HTH domain
MLRAGALTVRGRGGDDTVRAANRNARFADLLKVFRARRGLSQLQLADVTGFSQRHISFLESARSHPTRGAVLTIADALCDSLEARNALLRAARYADEYPASSLTSEPLKLALDSCRQTLKGLSPLPAILLDREWKVLAANRNATAFFARFQDSASPWTEQERNAMRTHFEPNGLRKHIVNWPAVAQHFMLRVRLRSLDDPSNEVAAAIVRDFGLEVDKLVIGRERLPPAVGETAFTVELRLRRERFRYQTLFSAFSDPQDLTAAHLRIETFVPADAATRDYFIDLDRSSPG